MAWEVINPAIQILIYWFVFGTLRNRAPVEVNGTEVPFFMWLLAGFFLWIFSFQSMIEGSKSIYSRLRMLSKMSFPFSVIPNFVIFSKLYRSEEHTSELQSRGHLVCRLLLEN